MQSAVLTTTFSTETFSASLLSYSASLYVVFSRAAATVTSDARQRPSFSHSDALLREAKDGKDAKDSSAAAPMDTSDETTAAAPAPAPPRSIVSDEEPICLCVGQLRLARWPEHGENLSMASECLARLAT